MKINAIKEKIVCPQFFLGIMLTVLICVYHGFYIRSVIPPEVGWWHYFGWRLNEGDLLYKDVYCHVQPFFPWFVAILYKFFGSHFIYYIIPGLLIRIIETLLVYTILLRISRPAIAAFSSFIAIIFTASAVYDNVFDYNTTILFLTIVEGYLFIRFYESYEVHRKRFVFCILSGIFAAIHFMSKQNTGTIVPFCIFILIAIVALKKGGKKDCFKNLGVFCASALCIIIPPIIYITATGSMASYINCVVFGMSAKGSMVTKFNNVLYNMLNIYDILIAVSISIIIYLGKCKQLVSLKSKYYFTRISLVLTAIILVFSIKQRFGFLFYSLYEEIVISPKRIGFVIIVGLLFLFSLTKGYKILSNALKHVAGEYFIAIIIGIISFILLLYWYKQNIVLHEELYNNLNFASIKIYLVYITYYLLILFWIEDTLSIIRKIAIDNSMYMFNTIILAFFLSNLLSATPEELFILPAGAYVLTRLFNSTTVFNLSKNIVLIITSLVFVLLCFSQRIYIPYTWHGWTESSIESGNLISSNIKGLEGYLLPKATEDKYEKIVNAILDNSSIDDKVYQFPNITLFNVLTHRQAPTYMPVHYFDICSDETAIADAKYLTENPPKIVIWDELGEANWLMHEQIYRGGKKSGQRSIQEFYNTIVREKYSLAVSVDNNQGSAIEVWVLDAN